MKRQLEIAEKYKNMVSEMEKIKQYIANSSSAKQAILDKYLKEVAYERDKEETSFGNGR